jgi:hypothetical protein
MSLQICGGEMLNMTLASGPIRDCRDTSLQSKAQKKTSLFGRGLINNTQISSNSNLGDQYATNKWTCEWKTGPENGTRLWLNDAAATGVYNNRQNSGWNGDNGMADSLAMWSSNDKWDDTNNRKNYITEYGSSGPHATVVLTGTPINGIEYGSTARFTITANKFVPSDYYDVRNTDGNTTPLSSNLLAGSLSYNREASYNSTVGFYQVLDRNGSLYDSVTGRTLDPTALLATDQARYRELALSVANRATALDGIATTNRQLTQKDFSVAGGVFYAPFAIVASTQQTYFAFAAANTDGINHFKMMGSNVFGLEDMHGGGDKDYNDLLVGIDFKNYAAI